MAVESEVCTETLTESSAIFDNDSNAHQSLGRYQWNPKRYEKDVKRKKL